jgi:hypothetical protein
MISAKKISISMLLAERGLVFVGSAVHGVVLTFRGTIVNLLKYEYHASTDSYVYRNNTSPSHPLQFSIDMQLGTIYEPVPPSEFLVLEEPSPSYSEMNWKDLNLSISDDNGSHYLHYSEAHTEGYGTDSFCAHQVEFGNGYSIWFLDKAWGNANDRYNLLYDYIKKPDVFSYEEKAYTTFNWNPATSPPNLIRIGQVATGTLTLIDITRSTQPILDPLIQSPGDIDLVSLQGAGKRLAKR